MQRSQNQQRTIRAATVSKPKPQVSFIASNQVVEPMSRNLHRRSKVFGVGQAGQTENRSLIGTSVEKQFSIQLKATPQVPRSKKVVNLNLMPGKSILQHAAEEKAKKLEQDLQVKNRIIKKQSEIIKNKDKEINFLKKQVHEAHRKLQQRIEMHQEDIDRIVQMALEEQQRMQFIGEQIRLGNALPEEPDIDNMTYEQLLRLGEEIGHVSKGLTEEEIRSLPTFEWRDLEKEQCIVCQEDKLCGETVTELPLCKHSYHQKCISSWLEDQKRCPICSREVIEQEEEPEVSSEGERNRATPLLMNY